AGQHLAGSTAETGGTAPRLGACVLLKGPIALGNDNLQVIQPVIEVAGAAHALGNTLHPGQPRSPYHLAITGDHRPTLGLIFALGRHLVILPAWLRLVMQLECYPGADRLTGAVFPYDAHGNSELENPT